MSGVGAKTKKSQSRKPASVSQSRRPKSSVYSSVRQKSLASKKNLSVKIKKKDKKKKNLLNFK